MGLERIFLVLSSSRKVVTEPGLPGSMASAGDLRSLRALGLLQTFGSYCHLEIAVFWW